MQDSIRRWSGSLFRAGKISQRADRLLDALAPYLNAELTCELQRKTLIEQTGMGKNTVVRATEDLVSAGILATEPYSAANGMAGLRYQILVSVPGTHSPTIVETPQNPVVIPGTHPHYKIESSVTHTLKTKRDHTVTPMEAYREATYMTNKGRQDSERGYPPERGPEQQKAVDLTARLLAEGRLSTPKRGPTTDEIIAEADERIGRLKAQDAAADTLSPAEWAEFERSLRANRTAVVDECPARPTMTLDEIRKAA